MHPEKVTGSSYYPDVIDNFLWSWYQQEAGGTCLISKWRNNVFAPDIQSGCCYFTFYYWAKRLQKISFVEGAGKLSIFSITSPYFCIFQAALPPTFWIKIKNLVLLPLRQNWGLFLEIIFCSVCDSRNNLRGQNQKTFKSFEVRILF